MAPGPKHLTTGDSLPSLQPGVLRIYSMKFCPFAERTRLVLHAKGIENEVVNINTWKKPNWFVGKNPKQLVPVLEQDDKIIYESMITSHYLEDIYPDQTPLRPKDPYQRAQDAMLLDFNDSKVVPAFYKSRGGKDTENLQAFKDCLQRLEDNLKKRGSDYYFGPRPGFVDYMLWPLFVRIKSAGNFGEGQGLPASYSTLIAWVDRMKQDPSVKSTIFQDSAYSEFSKNYRTENTKFDEIETEN